MYRLLHSFLLFSAIALSVHFATAQESSAPAASTDKGVRFEHDLSWAQIQAKAKSEHKYIFVDGFTTWCGPCRFMRTKIFPQEETGAYFNDKFISVEVQLDTTAKDNDHVKSWYADAHELMTKYGIRAFPTYLVFTPEGQPLHRLVGSTETAAKFIDGVRESFDTTKQFYTQLRQFEAGRRDTAFLYRLAFRAMEDYYDLQDGAPVFNAWLAAQPSPYTTAGMKLMQDYTSSTTDPGFALFLHHSKEVDKVLGDGKAASLVNTILLRQYVIHDLRALGGKDPDWTAIQTRLAADYPAQAAEVTARGKVNYYEGKRDWPNFQTTVVAYMQKYGAHATPGELNDFAWAVFSNCPDMKCVEEALEWSKRSFKDKPVAGYMDTYANILYKMGKKDDAIAWEQKAADAADSEERAGYQQTIDKMKKGEKTWN